MSTMTSNTGVWMQKKEAGVKKDKKGKVRSMKKEGKEDKQGREEGLACQHAAISAFILAEHPDTRGRSPWHTAFTKAVFGPFHHNNKSQVKTQCTHTRSGFVALGL